MPAVNSGKTSEQLSAFHGVKSITSSQTLLTTLFGIRGNILQVNS